MPELPKEESVKTKKKGGNLVDMLDCMAKGFDVAESKPETVDDEESALQLIESFSIGKKRRGKQIGSERI